MSIETVKLVYIRKLQGEGARAPVPPSGAVPRGVRGRPPVKFLPFSCAFPPKKKFRIRPSLDKILCQSYTTSYWEATLIMV